MQPRALGAHCILFLWSVLVTSQKYPTSQQEWMKDGTLSIPAIILGGLLQKFFCPLLKSTCFFKGANFLAPFSQNKHPFFTQKSQKWHDMQNSRMRTPLSRL